jgi:hypothetical protein
MADNPTRHNQMKPSGVTVAYFLTPEIQVKSVVAENQACYRQSNSR